MRPSRLRSRAEPHGRCPHKSTLPVVSTRTCALRAAALGRKRPSFRRPRGCRGEPGRPLRAGGHLRGQRRQSRGVPGQHAAAGADAPQLAHRLAAAPREEAATRRRPVRFNPPAQPLNSSLLATFAKHGHPPSETSSEGRCEPYKESAPSPRICARRALSSGWSFTYILHASSRNI